MPTAAPLYGNGGSDTLRRVYDLAPLGILLAATYAPSAAAQTVRDESFAPARVAVLPSCPSNTPGTPDADEVLPALAAAGASIFAGVVSDVVKAGVQSLAAAIDQASREKAFGAEGSSAFQFYSLSREGETVSLEPRLGAGEASCLVISLDDGQGDRGTAAAVTPSDIPAPLLAGLDKLGIPRPALYAEAYLRMSGDGFVVRPHLIWYARRLAGAPTRATRLEFQATFATPATAEVGSGAFAVARIALPALAPGDLLTNRELALRSSGALSPRQTTGAVETRRQALAGAWATVVANLVSVENGQADVVHAEEDLQSAAAPTAELRSKVLTARRALEATKRRSRRDVAAAEALLPEDTEDLGTTTVTARIAFIRAPNKFGQAIAEALKARAAPTATAVETAITTRLTAPAWSAADTTLVQAATAVATAQQAYDAAMAGTDATTKATALATLRNAQAAANAAAAGAGRPLPYPGLLSTVAIP